MIGSDTQAVALFTKLLRQPQRGLRPVGFIDDLETLDTDLDPELSAEQLAAVRAFVGPQLRGPDKPFGPERPCPADSAPADQLAAFLGRNVQ